MAGRTKRQIDRQTWANEERDGWKDRQIDRQTDWANEERWLK